MTTTSVARSLAVLTALTLVATVGASTTAYSTVTSAASAAPSWWPAQLAEGRPLYLEHCRACHGVLGAPTKQAVKKYPKIPNLSDAAFWADRSDDSVMAVLRKGVGRDMKAFASKLSETEMLTVAKYARSLVRAP